MSKIKPELDLMFSVKVLRPSFGHWSIVEKNHTWEDFDSCHASAMRVVHVGWRRRPCWIVAYKTPTDAFAALIANGLKAVETEQTFLTFHLYVVDPRSKGSVQGSKLLGGGLTIPQNLGKTYREAIKRLAK